jgi:NADPH-dependent 2,4-dienoyl-CoA reductase/sulfur reductase-like enzyme
VLAEERWPTMPRRRAAAAPAVAHPRGADHAATGAIERPIAFAGNDIPGVMLAAAVRDYVVNWGVSAR